MSRFLSWHKFTAYFCLSCLMTWAPALSEDRVKEPLLITFGPSANTYEGDHDFQQIVRISVPSSYNKPIIFKVFDADVGGLHDELIGSANSTVKYSLFGEDGAAFVKTDIGGEHNEIVSGRPIQQVTVGNDEGFDSQWAEIFEFSADQGKKVGDERHFFVLVEGLTGDDGNIFDVQISSQKGSFAPVVGGEIYTYLPTFRVAAAPNLTELKFKTPSTANTVSQKLTIENFDAAGARVEYHSPFETKRVQSSGQNEWIANIIDLETIEAGNSASITMRGGQENPNDASLFVTNERGQPLAIQLPLTSAPPNKRPIAEAKITPLSCSAMNFDASLSSDPDSNDERLHSYHWILDGSIRKNGEIITHDFKNPGVFKGRLEVFDHSKLVANGAFTEFEVVVKQPPVASFKVPAISSQTAEIVFDASDSKIANDGLASSIKQYLWDMGNGEIINSQDPVLKYRYSKYGRYKVSLTVLDDSLHPCNQAVISQEILVDAPPIANAGENLSVYVGQKLELDGSASSDPDGELVSYSWLLEADKLLYGRTISHAFHQVGTYQVNLNVADNSGLKNHETQDEIIINVSEKPNIRPVANAGENMTVKTGEVVAFSSLNSKDEDGKIIQTLWDFGDGSGGDRPKMEHTFWKAGTYNVSLSIKDDSGQSNDTGVDSINITVVDGVNREPIIDLKAPSAGILYEKLLFDASSSDDRDGSIVAYSWDFGDGAFASTPVVTHSYKKVGVYNGSLTITDSSLPAPGEVVKSFQVNISKAVNSAPLADAGDDMTVIVKEIVKFDGVGSQDNNGSILSYEWEFGDGQKATGIAAEHSYQFAGTYEAKLTVTDNNQDKPLSASDIVVIEVKDRTNQAPISKIASVNRSVLNEIIEFDGSQSSDNDGNIISYLWNFGNGKTSTAEKPQFTYFEPGKYRVQLTVKDDDPVQPLSATSEIIVDVSADKNGGADQ